MKEKNCEKCWYKQYCDEELNPDHKCYICEEVAQTANADCDD